MQLEPHSRHIQPVVTAPTAEPRHGADCTVKMQRMVARRQRRRLRGRARLAFTAAAATAAVRIEPLERRTLLAVATLLKDINPSQESLYSPVTLTDSGNGALYFTAGNQLWRSDGTDAGTFKFVN